MAKGDVVNFKYSIHLAKNDVIHLEDFMTDVARGSAQEINPSGFLRFPCKLFVKVNKSHIPDWGKYLGGYFETGSLIQSASASAVILFKSSNRIFACTFGYGHTMLDELKKEGNFGLIVTANSLSEENVRLVEKANLGNMVRDASQAAGVTNFQEFNVNRALSLVRRLSGASKSDQKSMSGAGALTLSSEHDVTDLDKLADDLFKLYQSTAYKKTMFAVIDKIKPVLDTSLEDALNIEMINSINSNGNQFEVGFPEIETEPTGYITISKIGCRKQYSEISLKIVMDEVKSIKDVNHLMSISFITHGVSGKIITRTSIMYKCIVGSLSYDGKRYAINEGKWYCVEDALVQSANQAFRDSNKGCDLNFPVWPIVGKGKKGDKQVYKGEFEYNKSVVNEFSSQMLLFDKKMITIPNNPGPGMEVCDIFDVENKKLIHVKKSNRKSNVISHFFMQGINSAKALKTYDKVKNDFFSIIRSSLSNEKYEELIHSFPSDWTVEFKFGDIPIKKGEKKDYNIPFFSRVTFDEIKREILALDFKDVEVSFIKLSGEDSYI